MNFKDRLPKTRLTPLLEIGKRGEMTMLSTMLQKNEKTIKNLKSQKMSKGSVFQTDLLKYERIPQITFMPRKCINFKSYMTISR